MNCKDCIQYDACSGYTLTDLDADVFRYALEGRIYEIPDIEERCSRFKDKSRYIELPCKVGDTVWHIRRTPEHMGGSYIVEAKIVCIPIRVYPNEVYFDLILRYTQRNGIPEEASSILGKYAFLMKEEAEKALAKMKGGEQE